MIGETGQYLLGLGLCLAIVQSLLSIAGALTHRFNWMAAGRAAGLMLARRWRLG